MYAFDDDWYKEHSGQILLIRLGVTAAISWPGQSCGLWGMGFQFVKTIKTGTDGAERETWLLEEPHC